jgi:predicted small lipoprotein YifL
MCPPIIVLATALTPGLKKYLWFRFPTDPIFFCRPYYFFNAIDCATLFSLGGCGLLIQCAKMASVVTLIIEPKCQYASLVNIDVGTLLQIAHQKNTKTMKKIFKKKFISDLLTLNHLISLNTCGKDFE